MWQNFLNKFVQWVAKFFQAFSPKKLVEVEFEPPQPMQLEPKPMQPTNTEKFIKICLEALDTDISPNNLAPTELSCAEGVSSLIQKLFPDFPIIVSTRDLFNQLRSDKRFKATLNTGRGIIVISPRTDTTWGHSGIFITEEKIASNNSFGKNAGKFTGNYDWISWLAEFKDKRQLHTFLFSIVDY